MLKRLVGDGDLRVSALQHMDIEQPPVEVGHVTQQAFNFGRMFPLAQAFVKELQQEVAVEGMELVFAPFLPHAFESAGEVVGIAIELTWCLCIQEALALDEIDEHQTVEHEGGIPLAISLCDDPIDEVQKRGMFAFETVIELLRHALDVEGPCHAPGHLGHLQALFLFQPDGEILQFLRQQFPGLPLVIAMHARGQPLALLAFDPQPYLVFPG